MLVHGYNPSDLLLSTIISISKDLMGSLSKSDNYRGISLVNSICKLFDISACRHFRKWCNSRLK